MHRLGILVSHPIQYYAPWFRYLTERMEIEVFYAHKQDAKGQAAAGFGVEFEWDVPLLDGYPYRWLKNVAEKPGVGTFRGLDTPELFDIIHPGKFDAFLLFSWNRKCSWQAIRACRRTGTPVLMRGDSHLGTKRTAITSLTKYLPYRAFLPRLDAHLYVGERNKEYLQHYGVPEDRLFFSPHFVDTEFFACGADEARRGGRIDELRRQLGIDEKAFVFLFVGKLIQVKRPSDLLEALLKMTGPDAENCHAIFVGDGPLRHELETKSTAAQGRIHFVGFQNQNELPPFYALADALVLPSTTETWGLVINEAQACGLPAIVSDRVGCVPDLLQGSGLTFSMGNVDELASQMLAMKDMNKSERQNMTATIALNSEIFSMANASTGLSAAITSVIRSGSSPTSETARTGNSWT